MGRLVPLCARISEFLYFLFLNIFLTTFKLLRGSDNDVQKEFYLVLNNF